MQQQLASEIKVDLHRTIVAEAERGPLAAIELRAVTPTGYSVIIEIGGEDIRGKKEAPWEKITDDLERVIMRDASVCHGMVTYHVVFHRPEGRNRGRFSLAVEGGADAPTTIGNGLARGVGSERALEVSLAHVSRERELNIKDRELYDARSKLLFDTLMRQIEQLHSVAQRGAERELQVLELANNLMDRLYERDRRRKMDDELDDVRKQTIGTFKTYFPHLKRVIDSKLKLLPPASPVPGDGAIDFGAIAKLVEITMPIFDCEAMRFALGADSFIALTSKLTERREKPSIEADEAIAKLMLSLGMAIEQNGAALEALAMMITRHRENETVMAAFGELRTRLEAYRVKVEGR